ncbi:MAG TPA: 3-phosphoshikimate 1-carboxyvinyltransferase [Caldilineaceae bacterium]|nr:3-phosphoshikimate 1-carboxyvinyltransferase [Caldilineaceae bacterium]
MTQIHIQSGGALKGQCSVPGDKSISHRAVMFASIAEGQSRIHNFLDGGDCHSTVEVMRGLGVEIEAVTPTELIVHGRGVNGLQEPNGALDCGNSGTTVRLLTGLLAGQKFTSFLTGTPQIRRRPMGRIVQPLRGMGAQIIGRQNGNFVPLGIAPTKLRGVDYTMPVASAQVKSCLLLAGLYAEGLTIVREPGPARDHTERMLRAMGAPISVMGRTVSSEQPSAPLSPIEIAVPGDLSSAAFLLVAGAIVPDSQLTIAGVGVNPTRIGIVDALLEMGAQIEFTNQRDQAGEPVADLVVSTSELRGATFAGENIVTMIDELMVLAVAATQASGRTVIRDAGELRVKETDRIASTVGELRKMGARIEPTEDGFIIDGPTPLAGAPVESQGDHRLAMAMTVAGLAAKGSTTVYGAEVTADSFPGFEITMQALGAKLEVRN